MRNYEVMYIINPNLDDANRVALIEEMHSIITNAGGSILKVDEWGLRELAYEINDLRRAYYVVVDFAVGVEGLNEFDRLMRINSNIVRYTIINKEEIK